jgi:hypothetical protein
MFFYWYVLIVSILCKMMKGESRDNHVELREEIDNEEGK